jgi:hypothetical protein
MNSLKLQLIWKNRGEIVRNLPEKLCGKKWILVVSRKVIILNNGLSDFNK